MLYQAWLKQPVATAKSQSDPTKFARIAATTRVSQRDFPKPIVLLPNRLKSSYVC